MKVLNQEIGKNFAVYHGDSCEVLKGIPGNSIHYSVTSIPFASLYTYSNSDTLSDRQCMAGTSPTS